MMSVLLLIFGIIEYFGVNCVTGFKFGDTIKLYASNVMKYENVHETYPYYSYPFCRPKAVHMQLPSLGEALSGIPLVESEYQFFFMEKIEKRELCSRSFSKEEVEDFEDAIRNEYWYSFYFTDLPVYGAIGKYIEPSFKEGKEKIVDGVTKGKYFIYTHQVFRVGYNKDKMIVKIDLESTGNPRPLSSDTLMKFTYSVQWEEVDLEYSKRFARYLDDDFFENKMHWFALTNSMLLTVFLVGLVVLIMYKTIRQDTEKTKSFSDEDSPIASYVDESAWKKLYGDIYRSPSYLGLFSCFLGTGVQLAFLVFLVILFSILGQNWATPGMVRTLFIIFYIITAILNGFFSGSYYVQNNGKNWIRVAIMTSMVFPLMIIIIVGSLNFFSNVYRSSQSIPFLTIFVIFALHTFLTIPLIFIGTILARTFNYDPGFPVKAQMLKRIIPRKPFWGNRGFLVCVGGLLPFGCIFIECQFILTSFTSFRIYYVFGFCLTVYLLMICTICSVSICLTYLLLNAEDYRYHWTSYFVGASTGIYLFIYCLYFYAQSSSTGFYQLVYFLAYSFLYSLIISFISGTISFFTSHFFVKKIYKNVKLE